MFNNVELTTNLVVNETQLFDILLALNTLLNQSIVTEKGIANKFAKRANLEAFKLQLANKLQCFNQMSVCAN